MGLGAQDDLAQARRFNQRHGLSFQMLWDESFQSWRGFRVTTQPVFILLSRGGEEVQRWTWTSGGTIASWEDEIVARASKL